MKKNAKKILYFEGAGCVPAGEVANCRIRTAFTNNNGKKVYIEFTSYTVTKDDHKKYKRYLGHDIGENLGFCDYCHYITDDPKIDDCNKSRLSCERNKPFIYTYEGIKNFINENCNASFDEIIVLDNLAGYKVFNDSGKHNTSERYNFGDTFVYDEELTKKRIAKVAELSEHFKRIFNQKYDNTSYYIENNALTVCINVEKSKRIAAGYTNRKFIVEV